MNIREKLIDAINSEIDGTQILCAESIANRILSDIPDIKNNYEQGAVWALARLVEMYDMPTLAISILREGKIDVSKAFEYDVKFLRDEDSSLPEGVE